jgi:regulator of protease activity HflC (stomatin/prohibitin superfamily)
VETWQSLVIAGVLVLIAIVVVFSTIKIVPQAQAGIVERLGRYNRTLDPGLAIIVPFIDRLRPLIDLREQVVSFAPQPVITSDNLVVSIDSVIYFQVTDPKAATYEIQSYLQGVEQLTVTTLRNVVGSLDLEETLTSRDNINAQLRGVLDEATGKWGIRVNRVELKAIDPPASVQQSMEKQMRADRDKRAAILNAEGNKQAAILDAEGSKTAAVLKAEGQARAQVLRAEGEAEAIAKVFNAINSGHATDQVMAYQYLQSLPLLAQGTANKVFVIPAELSGALGAVTRAFLPGAGQDGPGGSGAPGFASWTATRGEDDPDVVDAEVVEPEPTGPSLAETAVAEARAASAEAQAAADRAAYGHEPTLRPAPGTPGPATGGPDDAAAPGAGPLG